MVNECIAKSFAWAHEADPFEMLVLNDYGPETKDTKQDTMFEEMKQLLSQGVPINAVGLQSHISIYSPTVSELRATIERFASLGVKVQITEPDVSVCRYDSDAMIEPSETILKAQATCYKELFELFEEEY